MIEIALIIAIVVNFLININPVYKYLLDRYKLNKPPLGCIICLAFWISFIVAIVAVCNALYPFVALPFVTPFIASMLDKIYNNLPTKI